MQKSFNLWPNRVDSPLGEPVNQIQFFSQFIQFSLQKNNLLFLVCNDGIERSLDFGQDSVSPTGKHFVQELTINSQEIIMAARSLLLSQRQIFLNIYLARIAYTPNRGGTMEMRDELLSSVCPQNKDTRG